MFNHIYAKNILNALFNTSKKTSNNTISFPISPYIALFTTMPSDAGTGAVEIGSAEYSRVLLTDNGAYGQRMMAEANTVNVTFSGDTVTVTRDTSAPNDLTYAIEVTVGGSVQTLTVTVQKGTKTGTATASGTITTEAYSFDEVLNQDNITFAKCIKADWAPAETPVVGFGIYDAKTGGNLVYWDKIETPMPITIGTIPIFDIENLLKVKIS